MKTYLDVNGKEWTQAEIESVQAARMVWWNSISAEDHEEIEWTIDDEATNQKMEAKYGKCPIFPELIYD